MIDGKTVQKMLKIVETRKKVLMEVNEIGGNGFTTC